MIFVFSTYSNVLPSVDMIKAKRTTRACALQHTVPERSCVPIHVWKGVTIEAVSMVRRTVRRGTRIQCTHLRNVQLVTSRYTNGKR